MALGSILRLVFLGSVVLLLLVATWWAATCTADRGYADRPPAEIPAEDVVDELDFGPEIPLLERPFRRHAEVLRAGIAPGAARAAVDSFVAAAVDSNASPVFPPIRGRFQGDRLSLRLPRSDGALVARDFECPDPCEFGAQDSVIFATHTRALPRLLPRIGKTALVCGLTAGAGYALGAIAKYEHPEYVAGAAAMGCVVIRIM